MIEKSEIKTKLIQLLNNFIAISEEFLFYLKDKDKLKKYDEKNKLLDPILESCKSNIKFLKKILKYKNEKLLFKESSNFLNTDYYNTFNLIKKLFLSIMYLGGSDIFTKQKWGEESIETFVGANYILLSVNYNHLKEVINQYFVEGYKSADMLIVDEMSPLWDTEGMSYNEYPSDLKKLKEYTKELLKEVAETITKEQTDILQWQINEIIKNAIKHGNKNDISKKVKVWTQFTNKYFKIIVEDEGNGFEELELWNEFNKKRNEAIKKNDMEAIFNYLTFKSKYADESDGGNALFAALEYWDSGLIYNNKKNKLVALKYFH